MSLTLRSSPQGHQPLRIAALIALAIGATALSSTASAAGGKGLTFGVYSHDSTLGVDRVGIYGSGDPYVGDTQCKRKMRMLCTNIDGSARPNYDIVPAGTEFYQGWIEGHFAHTLPIRGTDLTSPAVADGICQTYFGPGWRMAEFHDGAYVTGMDTTHFGNTLGSLSPWPTGPKAHGGHGMWGYSHLNPSARYWVSINDQPANCWNP